MMAHRVPAGGGAVLNAFSTGLDLGRTVVFVNAFGISNAIAGRIAKALRKAGMGLVSWESRGFPCGEGGFHAHGMDDHASDLIAVLDYFGLDKAPVVGWCSGGEVSLLASLRAPARLERLVLVNSYFSLDPLQDTSVGRDLSEIIRTAARGRREAAMVSSLIARSGTTPHTLGLDGDREIFDWVSEPFNRDAEVLYRYSAMLCRLYDNGFETWGHRAERETHVIWGGKDLIVPVANQPAVKRILRHARFEVLEDGDHYAMFRDPSALEAVIRRLH